MTFITPKHNFDNNNLTQNDIDLITPVHNLFPSADTELSIGLQAIAEEFISLEDRLAPNFRENVHMVTDLTHDEGTKKRQANSSEELRMTSDVAAPATISITIAKIKGLLNNCYPTLDHRTRDYFHDLIRHNLYGKVNAEVKHLLELKEKLIISEKHGPARRKFIKFLKENGISTKEKTDKHSIKTEYITRLIQNLDPNFSDKKIPDYFNKILLPFCRDHQITKVDLVNFGAEEAIINLKTLFKNLKKDHNITSAIIENTNRFLSSISNELQPIFSKPIQDDNTFQSEDTRLPFGRHQFQGLISQEHRYPSDILSFEQEIDAAKGNSMSLDDIEAILLPDSNPRKDNPLPFDRHQFQSRISQEHRYPSDILSFEQEIDAAKGNSMSLDDAAAILLPDSLSLDDRSDRNVTAATFNVIDLTNDEGIKKRKTNSNETSRIVSEPDVPNTILLSNAAFNDFIPPRPQLDATLNILRRMHKRN